MAGARASEAPGTGLCRGSRIRRYMTLEGLQSLSDTAPARPLPAKGAPMEISAVVKNSGVSHEVGVRTDRATRMLAIPAKAAGSGSAVNGGEFLMLALATCYCNDLYREAEHLHMALEGVEVEAT